MNIIVSSIISLLVGNWYVSQMTKRTLKWMNEYFEQQEKENKEFIKKIKSQTFKGRP